jgi:hypothetical protein
MDCRMQCTSCFETADPETILDGSDLTEIVSWLCFVLPGWLYCFWRHSVRRKVCRFCGSESLIREARAAQARNASQFESGRARIRSALDPRRWPHAFATPRKRLVHGGIGALLLSGLSLCWLLAALPQPSISAGLSASFFSYSCVGWMIVEMLRVLRHRAPRCSAWDESGREISIEWIR